MGSKPSTCQPRAQGDPLTYHLTNKDSMGLVVVTTAGTLSLFSIAVVASLIVYRRFYSKRVQGRFEPTDIVVLSLFFAETLLSTGSILNIKWLRQEMVQAGNSCNAQGVVKQLGELGVAFSTILIVFYTGILYWHDSVAPGRWRSRRLAALLIFAVWLTIVCIVAVANSIERRSSAPFHVPTPFWCWINEAYPGWRWNTYAWFWIAMLTSLVVYLCIGIDHARHRIMKYFERRKIQDPSIPAIKVSATTDTTSIHDGQLPIIRVYIYPLVYILVVLPISIARWDPGCSAPAVTLVGSVFFSLSGFLNVVTLLWTRPDIELFRASARPTTLTPPSNVDLHGTAPPPVS